MAIGNYCGYLSITQLVIKEHSMIFKREHYDFNGYVTIYDFIVFYNGL